MSDFFLQSKEWMEFQKSIGREVFEFDGSVKARAVIHDMPLGKHYLYIPHGPEMDFNAMQGSIKNEVRNFVEQLKKMAKDRKSVFVKAEPVTDSIAQVLVEFGFKKSKKEITPKKTILVDLNKTEDELLSFMHHKTRYNIKVAEKHDIVVNPSTTMDEFWRLLKKTTARDKFSSHTKNYYEKLLNFFGNIGNYSIKIDLFLAIHKDKPVAGAMILRYGDAGYYLHGASDYEFRSMMAPYLLHWNIMKHLKQNGMQAYDFWGIDAKKWPGVTRFKLGWGGRTVERPGSFDLPIYKLQYLSYKMYRGIFK